MRLDVGGFKHYLKQLHSLGGDVKGAVEDALGQASKTITDHTEEAMAPANLPAGGQYSHGATKESIIRDNRVRWEGLVGWVPVGFDFSKPGAGGYLITGTPRMAPDKALNRMYKGKKFMQMIQEDISDILLGYIEEKMVEE
jgi:hypothetical protein